jgi:hypothetical protein
MEVKVSNKKYNILIVCFFIVVFYCFISCTTKRELPQAYKDLKMFVIDQNNCGYMYMLFFKTKESKIGYIEAFNLQRNLYNDSKYNGINKEALFEDIMDNSYSFECEYLTQCFTPNAKIQSFYKQHSVDGFIKKYTKGADGNNYTVDSQLNIEEQLTVIYCLYHCGIYTVWDDYSGFYIFTKDKPKLNKAEEIELIEFED